MKRSLTALKLLDEEPKPPSYACDPKKCFPCLKGTTEPPVPPELRKMKRIGFKMAPLFFFPALPKVLQDIWVGIELFLTFFELAFASATFGDGGIANILVVVLSSVNVILASFDGFFYFIEGGSCASLFKWGRKKHRKRRGKEPKVKGKEPPERGEDGEEKKPTFRERARNIFATGSEVVRVGLTELLLYPLTILDLFELIESETYQVGEDSGNRINFSLLNIGLFYLLLTVYLIRIFISLGAVISISRLPKTTTTGYHNLLKKFSIHIIGQIFVHMIILVMVATKIESEVCVSFDDSGSGSEFVANVSEFIGNGSEFVGNATREINISPFLYVSIFTGDVIPFLGVLMFFVVNYPALKQFMMGFCIDMMSTIVTEDFASTAFKGEGIKNLKKKTTEVHDKVNLDSIRDQFDVYKNVFSLKRKLAYRLTNPFVVLFSGGYFFLITAFLVCHVLGWSDPCDSTSGVTFSTFDDRPGVLTMFIVGLIAISAANFQVVYISLIWLVASTGLILFIGTFPLVVLLLSLLIAIILLLKELI